jgi:hypothetical protein
MYFGEPPERRGRRLRVKETLQKWVVGPFYVRGDPGRTTPMSASSPPSRLITAHRLVDQEGHRALEHITRHPQLGVLPTQPGQLGPLILTQRPVAAVALVGEELSRDRDGRSSVHLTAR